MKRRALLPRQLGFWFSGPCLAVAILVEGVFSLFRFLFFPLYRGATRRRIRQVLMRPRDGAVGMVAALFLLVAAPASGCRSFPGSSFGHQVQELGWSTRELLWSDSPADDLKDLAEDLESILVGRDGEDLRAEPLVETLELLGW